jgi:glutathione S-transferase
MIELYHNDISVCAQKVRIILFEKKLDWTSHALNLRKGDQFTPDYARLNPNGVVPTLVHDGRVVLESNAIIEYIDDRFPEPSFRPEGDAAVAAMRHWFSALDERIHMLTGVLSMAVAFRHEYFAEGQDAVEKSIAAAPEPMRDAKRSLMEQGVEAPVFGFAVAEIDKALGEMETALEMTGWFAGDRFSLVDIALMPYLARFDFLGMASFWDERPAVARWLARVKTRPGYQRVLVDDVAPRRMADLIRHGKEEAPRLAALRESLRAA